MYVLKEDLMNDIKDTPKYLTIFIDGSTDVSTTERELMYILYIHEGVPTVKFLKLEHLASANASSIVAAIKSVIGHFNLSNHGLVAFVSNGASVNFGRNSGVVTRLRQEYPDLLGIHCMNHRLELAAKDAFKGTSMEEVITMLNSLYALYSRSPKRMGKLEEKDITHFNVALTYLTTFYQRINDLLSALRALREPEDHEDVISTDVDGRSLNESDDEPAAKRPALTKDYMVADFQKILHDLMETDSGMSFKDVQLKASNAIVERGFSAMNRVKSDYRNKLATDTLDELMRITLSGPREHIFDSSSAATCFLNRCSRRPGQAD
ncbi:E3 SUMO-protein ligase KIAA1586-like [Patiria miniata]|uniref:DUF4371 domain-containing protein n=1 Tax=Patiria miniata TaxID=46514 RepID=A0A914AI27_PATMI|nr:E3 SUMO-protein ligase KIAA1586-like [Patiria miniata]